LRRTIIENDHYAGCLQNAPTLCRLFTKCTKKHIVHAMAAIAVGVYKKI
jgi:hypothetical protein